MKNTAKILLALTINFLVVFNSYAEFPATGQFSKSTSLSTACSATRQNLPIDYTVHGYPIKTPSVSVTCGPIRYRYCTSTTPTGTTCSSSALNIFPTCPTNSTFNTTNITCTCNSGYTEQNGTCIQPATPPTCTSPQVLNTTTNQCENPINYCDNTTNQQFDYKATNNAEIENITLLGVETYEYLCYDTCKYQVTGNPTRCYVLANDTSPRPGYCEQSYTPTFQNCDAGEAPNALILTPPADVTTCPTNHTLNSFDVCTPDEVICPADTELNSQNVCENKPCSIGYERLTEQSQCTPIPPCPTGQYRNAQDTCQTNPTCPNGQYSIHGSCQTTKCPNGQYRAGNNNECINIPNGQILSTCTDYPAVGQQLSQCAIEGGFQNGGNNPNTTTCTVVQSFGNGRIKCVVSKSPTLDAELDSTRCDSPAEQDDWECQNKDAAKKGFRYLNTNQIPPDVITTTTQAYCPANHTIQTNGFCRPDECINNPSFSPACSSNGLFQGGVSGGTGDLTETNSLLTNIKEFLNPPENPDQSSKEGFQEGVTLAETNALQKANTLINDFIDNNEILDAYQSILPVSPWESLADEAGTQSCVLETSVLGHAFNLDLCKTQESLHPLITYFLFILVSIGVFNLIFERPQT